MVNSDDLKRAEAGLRIAQLKFKQQLKQQPKRSDDAQQQLPPVALESSTSFFADVDAVLRQNTEANVQTCKKWIVRHIAPAKARVPVLGEYLVAVSKSIVVDHPAKSVKAARSRLAVLLIVSDVLHADKFHPENGAAPGHVAANLKPYIETLVELAALAVPGKDHQAKTKLKAVLNHWVASGYLSPFDFASFRERADSGLAVARGETPQLKRTHELPIWFGDRDVAWHGLSASYMVEPLLKNPDRPIPPNAIYATRFDQKQPSERTRKLLDDYFENIDLTYVPNADNPTGDTEKHKLWLDPMGQIVKKHKDTQEVTTICNPYGWSTKFCEEMQEYGVPLRVTERRAEFKEKAAQALRESRQKSSGYDYGYDRRYSYSSDSYSRSLTRSRSKSFDDHGYHDRPRSSDQRRPVSRDDGRKFSDRSSRFNDGGRPSQESSSRKRPRERQSRWNDGPTNYSENNRNSQAPAAQQHNYSESNTAPQQGFPLQPSHNMRGFNPPPPPPPGRGSGYPTSGFPPPPPPPPPQHFQNAGALPPPPPPPPNYQGQFYGAHPNAGGFHNNAGGFQNNGAQYRNNAPMYQGNDGGHRGQARGNHRGGYQSGQRGGFRGGYQGQGRGMGRY